jgi:nicotinamide riboside kinase
MDKKTVIINMFGGPGSGKSTLAALLFARLKLMGVDCELITEFAKKLTWHDRHNTLKCQQYVFGKQSHEIEMIMGQVDIVVTDSPTLLSAIYAHESLHPSFKEFVIEHYRTLPTINYYLRRVKPYNPNGRNQTAAESDEIGRKIVKFLDDNLIPYKAIDGCEFEVQNIVTFLRETNIV